jgi:competence protein ComEC
MLVDGGGFPGKALDAGRMVIAPFLWNRGLGKIDYMAATHSDNDHIAGLESLLDLFKVDYLLQPETGIADRRLAQLRQKALDKRAAPLALKTGEPVIREGEVTVTPIHPDANFADGPGGAEPNQDRVSNDYSLTLRVDYRQFSMLLTGDIGKRAETYLTANHAPLLRADFLKGPHHGSKHSNTPEFIQAVRPKAAFFSAGYLNQFRHPSPEALKRYDDNGIPIWRTDRDGAVFIATDGYNHEIETHGHL